MLGPDFEIDHFVPHADRVDHFAKMQLHTLRRDIAALERFEKTAVELFEHFAQRQIRTRGSHLAGLVHRLEKRGAVEAGLVAEVIGDSGDVGASRQADFANRRLGETLFGKEPERDVQQPVARIDAVSPDRMGNLVHDAL